MRKVVEKIMFKERKPEIARYYTQGDTLDMIEGDYVEIPIDCFDTNDNLLDMTGGTATFNLMDFTTRVNVLSKEAVIIRDPTAPVDPSIDYPFTALVQLENEDTDGLEGRYTGHLVPVDYQNVQHRPYTMEIIIRKNADA
jgi:hypothetical protein